jgi:hypothetical protein
MGGAVVSANGGRTRSDASAELSSVALFALLWDALADLLGTAAAAAILRRAVRRAAAGDADLARFAIVRENLEYRYLVPPSWNESSDGADRSLRCLVSELLPLLVELTGPVVVRRLAQIPELVMQGIIPNVERAP